MSAIACFDVGGSFIRYGLRGDTGGVAIAGRVPTPGGDFDAFVEVMSQATGEMQADVVSLSIAGAYDRQTGVAQVANIPCLNGRRLAADLEMRLGLPVLVHNDADCFALAEAHGGAGRGRAVVFGIILGTGVGGGIVVDGRLISGHGGIAGEWGHGALVDPRACGAEIAPEHMLCGCGRVGCIDAVGSARGLEKLHLGLHGVALASTAITAAWDAGDAQATASVELYTCHIARGLGVMVNLLGPGAVPVGGGMASNARLIARMDELVRGQVLARYDAPLVVPGRYVSDGGLIGAGIAAAQAA